MPHPHPLRTWHGMFATAASLAARLLLLATPATAHVIRRISRT